MRYTIGQFAGMHQVSKKTLRHYKDIGLLEPAGFEPDNGYAFYEDEQRERLMRIQYLRRLRFPLEDIRQLLTLKPGQWDGSIQSRLAVIRSEARLLSVIEQELLALQSRICDGNEPYKPVAISTAYRTDTFELIEPIYVIGCAARVPYNQHEEKQRIIGQLINHFFGNDEPEKIPHQTLPAVSIGLVCECEQDMSKGTYMMGMQVAALSEIPEGMRSFTLPAGVYVRVAFQAMDRETLTNSALDGAYEHLYNSWLPESQFTMASMLAVELYAQERTEVPLYPEMELWQLITRQ